MYRLLFITLSIFFLLSGCTKEQSMTVSESSHARIKTVHGDIIFQFISDKAPDITLRIQEKIRNGFYNGLPFHRVLPGFIIQTGANQNGSLTQQKNKFKAEFNELSIKEGSVAIVRYTNDDNSADSQFFISLSNKEISNRHYTVFAYVTHGMDVAKKIQLDDKILTLTLEP